MRRLVLAACIALAVVPSIAAAQAFGDLGAGWGQLGSTDDCGESDPLAGPHYLHWDASDINGNGDSNAGWSNLDFFTAPGVGTKNWEAMASTATQSLTLGLSAGDPQYISVCSPSGLPCARLDGNDYLKSANGSATDWISFFADVESVTCSVAATIGDNDQLGGIYATRSNSATDGVIFAHDSRTTSDRPYSAIRAGGVVAQAFPNPGTASIGFAVLTQRHDAGTNTLSQFVGATLQTSAASTSSLSAATTTGFPYIELGRVANFGGTGIILADLYEILCWKSAKTDDDVTAIVDSLTAKWGP